MKSNKHYISSFKGERKFSRKQTIWFEEDTKIIMNGTEVQIKAFEKAKLKSGDTIEYYDDRPELIYSKRNYWISKFWEVRIKPLLKPICLLFILIATLLSILFTTASYLQLIFVLSSFLSIYSVFVQWIKIRKCIGIIGNWESVGMNMEIINAEHMNEKTISNVKVEGKIIKKCYTIHNKGTSRIYNFSYDSNQKSIKYHYIQIKEMIDAEPDNILVIGKAEIFLESNKGVYNTKGIDPNFGFIKLEDSYIESRKEEEYGKKKMLNK